MIDRLREAVRARREQVVDLTARLVREPSTLGNERGVQDLMAAELAAAGFDVTRVPIDPDVLASEPFSGYPLVDYQGRDCVVGRIRGAVKGATAFHLSGHVDVVPVDVEAAWTHDPWGADVVGDRLYGRGAGDMKAGVAAYLVAVAAILETFGQPDGDLVFSTVIEEECTGNGMASLLAAGHDADATLIGEPTSLAMVNAGVGVVWARLTARSGAAHPGMVQQTNASAELLRALAAVQRLESRLNEERGDPVFHEHHSHPYRLNIGELGAGSWPSSYPTEAYARIRLSFGRNHTPPEVQDLIARAVAEVTPHVEVTFEGFRARAYHHDPVTPLADALSRAHACVTDARLSTTALAATTDARWVAGPCYCYGPVAGGAHGEDEWVDLPSLFTTAEVVACTLAMTWAHDDGRQVGSAP